jgi:hypothetical protein
MTSPQPDEEPDAGIFDAGMAVARRYLSALNSGNHAALNRILCDLAADKDHLTIPTFQAMGAQCLDLADLLEKVGVIDDLQAWLDGCALRSLDDIDGNGDDTPGDGLEPA